MKEINILAEPGQTFNTTLDGHNSRIRIYWNEYHYSLLDSADVPEDNGRYYMDIQNELFEINGIALVTDIDLLTPYAIDNFGGIFVYDTKFQRENVIYQELGNRFALVYIELDELEEIQAALVSQGIS